MKKLFLTWIVILAAIGATFAQGEKTFVKTFAATDDCPFAVFTLKGPAVVYGWDEETIQINVKVTAPEVDQVVLDRLFKEGRYEMTLRAHKEAQLMIFEMPKQEQYIFINGGEILEEFEYEIFVPRGIRYRIVEHKVPLMM